MSHLMVIEVYDENDELVGFGICRTTGDGFLLLPEVYGVRSEAHAALAAGGDAAVRDEIKDALEGDSNDAEHDALTMAAELLGIEYRDPYDDDEDGPDEYEHAERGIRGG
jgi:HEAT repeat protein